MDFNIPPYYDDYDEAKKFLKVLFRPGYSVQARELTQLQTILQKQVSSVGDFLFKDKSRVIPGDVNQQTCTTIKLEPLDVDNALSVDSLVGSTVGFTAIGETTGVRASIIHVEKSDTLGNPALLYYGTISGGVNAETNFNANEVIKIETDTATLRFRAQNVSDYLNTGFIVNIEPGIFYVNGYFVQVSRQTIALEKYSRFPTYTVGLDIQEIIVTPEEDTSLLDNSVGTPNYTAPGAHRFKIDLVLSKKEIGFAAEDFIELTRYRNGVLEFSLKQNDLAYLQDVLAKRTYDESGDYIVQAFELEMREHRNSDQGEWASVTAYQKGDVVYFDNNGILQYYVCLDNGTSGSSAPTHTNGTGSDGGVRWRYTVSPKYDYGIYSGEQGGDESKIAFGLKAGSAYVKGYEYRTFGTTFLAVNKPREYAQIKNTAVPVALGNTLDVRMFGSPDIDNFQIVDLFKVDTVPNDGTAIGIMRSNGANSYSYVNATAAAYTPFGAGPKLGYVIICESSSRYYVEKLKADYFTTTTSPLNFESTTGNSWVPYLATTKIGTARIRYAEPYSPVNNRTTSKISLMDIQMNPGEDFKKVRVIGTPLSIGSTSSGGDPNCFRALVLPTSYNSTTVGSATVGTTGGFGPGSFNWNDMTSNLSGQGTKWTSGGTLSSGDMVWFSNDPSQFFFVRSLSNGANTNQTDNLGIVINNASYALSGNLLKAECSFENPQDYDSLFNLPKSGAYTIRGGQSLDQLNTSYTVLERYTASSTATTPITLTISTSFPDEFVTNVAAQFVCINQASGESVTPTSVTLTSNTQATITIDATGSISNAIANLQNKTYTIYAPTKKKLFNAKEKVKSLKTSTINIILQSALEQEVLSLFKADVYRLIKIEQFPNVIFGNDISGIADNTGIDITRQYELDNGQRDTHYDLARIIKGKAYPYPTGPIRVTFEYFEHSAGDYLSIDSYVDLLYEEVPTFFSKVTGRSIALKDVLDFRPRVNDAGTFDGGTTSSSSIPQRLYPINVDMAYYLGRKDAIILEKSGGLKVIEGTPSETPQPPVLPADTMVLYDVDYDPYVNKVDALSVRVKEHDHRRYTMRDIGKIEKRVQSIEQVTSLNLLEKDTASLNIKDQDGLDRFKNGFVVDNFKGHTTGNPVDPDYECSVDISNKECRPAFTQTAVDLLEAASSLAERTAANYRMHEGNVITLPYYTGAEYFYKNKNEIATINAKGTNATSTEKFRKEELVRDNSDLSVTENPYATDGAKVAAVLQANNTGIVTLVPASDSWIEENVPPELVIREGGTYDNVAAAADAFGIDFGTIWNGWQVTHVGSPVVSTSSQSSSTGFGGIVNVGGGLGRVNTTTTVTTSVTSRQVTERNTGNEVGIRETAGVREINGRLTARQSVSYIRSRPIVFVATGMKASTKVYAHMDEVNVTDYCTQATRLLLAARKPNYSYTPYQYGNLGQARDVYEVYNSDVYFGNSAENLERTFSGSLVNDTVSATTAFTSIYNGDSKAATNLVIDKALNDVARNLIAPNAQVTAFQRGEVVIGSTSGATGIVILHEQSTSSTTGDPDGLADVLHLVNVRGTFANGENLRGTLSRAKLNGGVLTLQLRGTAATEVAAPGNLLTTGTGRVAGVYMMTSGQVINNRASPKFLTGNRLFSISDSTTNDKTARTTLADTIYSATGIIDAGDGSFIGVRNGELASNAVSVDRQFTVQTVSQTTSISQTVVHVDPLAQTFVNSVDDGQDGCFVREIEIFFKQKDAFVPVTVELRTCNEAGQPSETVLPFGRAVLYPSDIISDSTGTMGTQVRFPAPIHLQNNKRYAIVLATVSPKYEVWSSLLGKTDVSKNKMGFVGKVPSLGSLFKSKNGASWVETPDANMKLNVYRCIFNTTGTLSSPSVVTLRNAEIEPHNNAGRTTTYSKFGNNPFRVKLNSSEVIVTQPNHGFSVGSYVSFQNVAGGSNYGFTDSLINTSSLVADLYDTKTSSFKSQTGFISHQVIKVYSHDRYSIRIKDAVGANTISTATGTFGGTNMIGTRNILFTSIHPNINYITMPNTSVTPYLYTTSGKSPHGNETPFQKDTAGQTIALNDNNYFAEQRSILNKHNEAKNLGRAPSFELKLELASSNRFVSPVIDLDRANVICIQNRVDDPVTIKSGSTNYYSATGGYDGSDIYQSEYENKGGAVQAAYITRKLVFKNTSKLLKVQVAASIPSNTLIDKSISTISLPIKFQSGARVTDHPSIITQRTAASTLFAIGSTGITLQSAAGIVKGMYVYGPGIQKGTKVVTASTSLVIDKALKENLPATATNGTVLFFSAFDISSMYTISQIDVGDYLSLPTGYSGIQSGTYVTQAPKNSFFTRKLGTYANGYFEQWSQALNFTITTAINRTNGWIDSTSNNMTLFVDSVSDIKVGTYAYVGNGTGPDGTYEFSPKSIRRVVQVNTVAKSVVLEKLVSGTNEFDSAGFSPTFPFNNLNKEITFFDPRIRISAATTQAIDPTTDATSGVLLNPITFTTPANAEIEIYAKTSTSGNATSSSAYTFISSTGVASSTITLGQTHNLSLGSPVTYNGENNVVGGLINGATYYAIVGTDFGLGVTQLKLALSANNAAAGSAITLTANAVSETHRIIDVNQKDAASIEDDQFFRILPDISIGGDTLTYGGTYTLATKGQLTVTDDVNEFIDHSFTVDNLAPFNTAIIKVVFRSRNPAFVPKIKDFRVIALA